MSGTKSLNRQEAIVRFLLADRSITVKDLAARLAVSSWTVRRDLAALERRGLVRRRYGMAEAVDDNRYESFLPSAPPSGLDEAKRNIGLAAARLVQAGQSIALSAGTTTLAVARALRERDVPCHIVTNALDIAAYLAQSPTLHVTCSGGDVDGRYGTLTGPVAERALASHYFDIAFIGVSGIGALEGVTANSQLNATVLQAMVGHAKRVVAVADHTKFGRVRFAHLASFGELDMLVTDRVPPPDSHAALEASMVDVAVVGPIERVAG